MQPLGQQHAAGGSFIDNYRGIVAGFKLFWRKQGTSRPWYRTSPEIGTTRVRILVNGNAAPETIGCCPRFCGAPELPDVQRGGKFGLSFGGHHVPISRSRSRQRLRPWHVGREK
jgi:hypothetical protein